MISSVSNVSFRSNQDLIGAPSPYSQQPAALPEMEADSFVAAENAEKKSKKGLAIGIGSAVALLGAFIGLGYAVKSGKLAKVDITDDMGFFKKAWTHVKNFGTKIGEYGEKCINTVAGWFGKGEKAAAEAGEAAADAAAGAAA